MLGSKLTQNRCEKGIEKKVAHLGTSWRVLGRLGAVLAPFGPLKKNLALQWNGKRAYLSERFHFEAFCCCVMQWLSMKCFDIVCVVSSCLSGLVLSVLSSPFLNGRTKPAAK